MPVVNAKLTQEQKGQLDLAVATFRGKVPIRVTPEKLSNYLAQTRGIDASPAQRLRWLAIALEHETFEHGWGDLRVIYQTAADADPTDPLILHSWGISASFWAETLPSSTPPSVERKAIAEEAERVLLTALELTPGDSRLAHTLGLLAYNHPSWSENPEGYCSRALGWFTRAVEWDSENVLAQLYLAHCYHDQKDWHRAIEEYEKVDLDRLTRRWPAWRAVKCREQLAHCHAYAGNTDESVRRFTEFLDDIESWDNEQIEERVINADELVNALTHKFDHPELLRRTRDLVKRLSLEKQYQQLFS
jgi:tetratricopeptide (TPR) repeat protein